MAQKYYKRIYCEIDNRWEHVWETTPNKLLKCPVDPTHRVRLDSTAIERTQNTLEPKYIVADKDPTTNDGSNQGYSICASWLNTDTGTEWILVDPQAGNAKWIERTNTTVVKAAYTVFFTHLTEHADKPWTNDEIESGLCHRVHATEADLPEVPTNPDEPNFAIIQDGSKFLKLAYWDYSKGGAGSWAVTSPPYNYPFLTTGHSITQDNSIGAGNVNWQYTMGTEYRIKNPGQIAAISFKMGSGGTGQDHRWEILKSSYTGPTAPATSTYSLVAGQTGLVNMAATNTWQEITLPSAITIAPDEWYIARVYLGTGSGQNAQIAVLRNNNQLREDYAIVHAGTYIYTAGGFPGTDPLPLGNIARITTWLYGMISLRFEEL